MKPYRRNDRLESVYQEIRKIHRDMISPWDATILLQIIDEREKEITSLTEKLSTAERSYSDLTWEKNP